MNKLLIVKELSFDNNLKVKIFKNKKDASLFLASFLVSLLEKSPQFNLGLATGDSPLDLYSFFAQKAKEKNLVLSKIQTFNLDEYLNLDETSKKSYRYFMNENLFSKVGIDKSQTHFPLENNYDSYDELIDKKGGIDFQLLGIGTNGHIGFNEPGTPLKSKTSIVDLAQSTIDSNARFFANKDLVPRQAYSMGLSTILKVKEIALIAFGSSKCDAIKKLLKLKDFDISLPASALLKHNKVTLYLDLEAACDLL
uniref:Glucosamine-6-phosphate deaminase n=1 Tax=Mycoplasmopsis synoviae TaxID=2109 RepID=C0KZ44_MYCSY|nr:glucosamine-6-phosphate deaminase [Mycoplasmopsis synoviae]